MMFKSSSSTLSMPIWTIFAGAIIGFYLLYSGLNIGQTQSAITHDQFSERFGRIVGVDRKYQRNRAKWLGQREKALYLRVVFEDGEKDTFRFFKGTHRFSLDSFEQASRAAKSSKLQFRFVRGQKRPFEIVGQGGKALLPREVMIQALARDKWVMPSLGAVLLLISGCFGFLRVRARLS